jgi:hypothetical protein
MTAKSGQDVSTGISSTSVTPTDQVILQESRTPPLVSLMSGGIAGAVEATATVSKLCIDFSTIEA